MGQKRTMPAYEHHRPTGTARVQWTDEGGKRRCVSLGKYGTPESKRKYAEFVARFRADTPTALPLRLAPTGDCETVGELVNEFLRTGLNGYSPSETALYVTALRVLAARHTATPVVAFGPRALAQVRDDMVAKGWTRENVNAQASRIKRVFRWAVAQELAPADKFHQLQTLTSLRKGKTAAPDQRKITPVPDAVVEATLPHLTPTVAAMVLFQRYTGCRPQDVCHLTPGEIDRSGEVWVFRPTDHKTAWRGLDRSVYIGPKAQAVLLPHMGDRATLPCFSPKRACQEHYDRRRARGKRRNLRKRVGPAVRVGERYSTDNYIGAIGRACERAGLPVWTPNQLRHSRLTEVRASDGLDAAQAIGGHKNASMTERYARPTNQAAVDAARKTG